MEMTNTGSILEPIAQIISSVGAHQRGLVLCVRVSRAL
jgi:hypothetical protein